MSLFFATSDGLNLHYTDQGSGVPILCLPGLTRTTADFDYVTPALSGCRLIKLDYRGRGASDWDSDWHNYTVAIECRDVLELLDHVNLERVGILGTSRGGLIAMALAAAAPDRVCGVALNDIGPVIEPAGLEFIMTYLGHDPAARSFGEAARSLRNSMHGFTDVPHSRWMEEAMKHFRKEASSLKITYDPKLRNAVVEQGAQPTPDLWPLFDALKDMPTAALRGENSELLSAKTFQKMQSRHPRMIAATVMGRGHIPFLDEPEAVATLQNWVEAMR